MSDNMTIFVVGSIVVPVILAIIARVIPKQNAIATGDSLGEKLGIIVSTLGNSRLGKKAMDAIEEGPIHTLIGFLMAFLVAFGRGLKKDTTPIDPMK